MIRVKRAASYGFCAGVRVADAKLRRFTDAGERGAILGQIVHNVREALEGTAKVERLGKIAGEIITPAEVGHAVLEGGEPVRV